MSRLSRAAAGGELRVDDGCVGAALAGPRRWLGSAVEWKKLGEVAKICRGVRVVKKELTDDGKYAVYQNSLKPLGYYGEANVKGGTAFVIGAGAAGEVGYSEQDFWAADDCYYIDGGERLIGRYVYYCLTSRQDWLLGKVRKASIPRLSRDFIAALEIPLPPLEIQREVVEILDNFANLTAELTAELAKRKKQYEHYRDMLLNFDGPDGVEWKRLGELCESGLVKMARGNVISKKDVQNNPGDYPIYSSSAVGDGEFGRYGKYMFDEELVTWSIDGGGKFFYREKKKFSVTNVCGYIRVENTNILLPKFLYHALASQWATKSYDYIHKALPSTIIDDYFIPLPPIAEQKRIVAILDRFDSLCNSLTEGLPAEIALRKKQYEYYRDKLLSFKEVG